MEINGFIEAITNTNFIFSLIVVLITIFAIEISKKIFKKRIEKSKKKQNRKKSTYLNVISNIVRYIIFFIGIIWILQINGVNVTSVLTGLGIASIITGLALQDALRDIIMGIHLIEDNYFSVGDVVRIDGVEGKVIYFGIKSVKIKDIYNENIYAVANRNIDRATVISTQLDIDLPLEYEEDLTKIEKVLTEICEEAKKNEKITDIKYMGVQEFADSAIKYKLRMWCNPEEKPIMTRFVNRIIKVKLVENNITVPYTQVDIHNK